MASININIPAAKPRLYPSSSTLITPSEIESEFSHQDPSVTHINNGTLGCCPASVIAAQQEWQLRYLRYPEHFHFNHHFEGILHSRTIIKDLVNAHHVDEISIVDNVSTAVAIVLQQASWAFREGRFQKNDVVLVFDCAYPAIKNSLEAYITRAGGQVVQVTLPFPVSSNDDIVSEFKKALERQKNDGNKVRLAVIDHVTFMPSVLIPVKELVRICREEGVDRVLVDAAHSIGCTDIDVQEIGADFYTSDLYKWFFTPLSVAFLYCRNDQYSECSGDLHHPVVSSEYGNGLAMESAWAGARDYSAQLAVPAVLEFVNRFEGGIEGIKKRNHEGVVEMGEMLAKEWGTHLGTPPHMCASMVMVGLPDCLGITSDSDAVKLWAYFRDVFGIEVRFYYRRPRDGEVGPVTGGYARISHQVYNKVDDYYKFRDAINQLVRTGFTCALLTDSLKEAR